MLQPEFEQFEPEKSVNNVRPFGLRDKIGYLFGDFGNDFFFLLASSYLMVFYTDIFHISAATVGVLFMIARFWDAFADVLWGRFIDTRKTTKHGKFKPWMFRMSFPLVFTGVLMFVKIPGMSEGFYLAWAFVTYILWGTLYSTVNIPYGSMASVITSDPVERTSLSTWRGLGATLAGLIINVGGPLLLFQNNQASESRFLITAIIFGILSLSCYMASVALTTERITPPEHPTEKGNFKKTLKGLTKNKPLLWILITSLVFMVTVLLIGTVNVYLFKDYFGSTTALSVIGFVQTAAVLVAMPIINPLVKRFGKKAVGSTGMLLAAAAYLLLYILPNVNVTTFIFLSGVGMFASYGLFNLIIWAFVTDVIDYHEFLTGLREDGTVYSIYSFARKIGQAVAGGIGGFAIAAIGYDATKAVQTKEALDGMYFLATLVPGILFALAFVMLAFLYPLNKARTNQLVADLDERRKQNAE
ncbi:MFS transporter [Oceanobacillus sp. Castelsardo]|uniref:MFS transporter n=1 Tax=Oceanobacillus sp. Castelsardo TaxID=1851204 RepID=UPI0008385713|nr:glycoside-pentoside-hexuronide (GPH):cation symporter [Oceanobacillus sp. Castelsardo]